jgi:putative membrane protein
MRTELLLSAFHFLLVFGLVGVLAAQAALVRPGMTSSSLRLAAYLDRGYGAAALLLVGIGSARVFFGAKGSQFYLANPAFWAKIVLFATVAILSIPPTVRMIRWLRQTRIQVGFLPPDAQIRGVQRWLLAEGIVLLFIPLVAAAMARGVGHL